MTYRADIVDEEVRVARRGRFRRRTWALIVLLGAGVLALSVWLGARAYLYHEMPDLPDKAAMWELNLAPNITVLDTQGRTLGHRGPDIGRARLLTELPRHLPDAFLAIEDERFYEHEGVDRQAILRAAWTNFRDGGRGQGGSTLTQQLVKNIALSPEKTYRRKFQEAVLAADMETVLTKPEILELYINRIPLGAQLFGVEAASRTYFGKPATEVTLAESALLAALPKAPSRLDPRTNLDGAWERAALVLDRMVANGMITPAEAIAARQAKPELAPRAERPLPPEIFDHTFDMLAERAEALVGGEAEDLVVTTTLDAELTAAAHAALIATLDRYGDSKRVSEGALVSLDNATGAVIALVGGRSYADSKFNRAVQAERQPGSAFKPFVYAAAIEDGFTPGTVRIDQPLTIEKWTPENYTKRYKGPMTIREALKLSINTVAAQVGAEVGPSRVAELARRFGVRSTELRPHYSLALGSSEVTLMDLTGAFAVFPNDGVLREPHAILRIEDTSGRVLYQRREREPERVFAREHARQMNSMMADVIESGTAYGARFGGRSLAGKTGTSQDYRDAWFVGYSPQITTGVWMGNDDNTTMKEVTGGLLPVDVWKTYMRAAHEGRPNTALPLPTTDGLGPYRRILVGFYEGLSEELESERNAAAGITQ